MNISVINQKNSKSGRIYFEVYDDNGNEYLCFNPEIKKYSGTSLPGNWYARKLQDGKMVLEARKSPSSVQPKTEQIKEQHHTVDKPMDKNRDYKAMLLRYSVDLVIEEKKNQEIKGYSDTVSAIKKYYNTLLSLYEDGVKPTPKPNTMELVKFIGRIIPNPDEETINLVLNKLCDSKLNTPDTVSEDVAKVGLSNARVFNQICPKNASECNMFENDKCNFIEICPYK